LNQGVLRKWEEIDGFLHVALESQVGGFPLLCSFWLNLLSPFFASRLLERKREARVPFLGGNLRKSQASAIANPEAQPRIKPATFKPGLFGKKKG